MLALSSPAILALRAPLSMLRMEVAAPPPAVEEPPALPKIKVRRARTPFHTRAHFALTQHRIVCRR